jgi:hypothetical protein
MNYQYWVTKALKLRYLPAIISLLLLTLGAWGLGHIQFSILPVLASLFHLTPDWAILWVKGLTLGISFLLITIVLILGVILIAAVFRKDTRSKEQKEHDKYYGDS